MILNVNKQEIETLLDIFEQQENINPVIVSHLKEKLKRLKITSETVKSTIEQVQATE